MSNDRVIEHKGYDVAVYDSGDIIIYRKGRFIMQALCWKGMSDEEVIVETDKLLAFREKLNIEDSFV